MHGDDTLGLARRLVGSVADSAGQTAGVLVALAVAGSLHPIGALAATTCGAALVASRFRRQNRDPMERPPRQRKALREGFSLRLGHHVGTGRPVELDTDGARQHMLVLGTTGSAKTEFLLGLSEQAIAAGSGLLFVDGKGDPSLFAKAFLLARRHGRLDDLLVLNLMTGAPDPAVHGDHLLSNTLNPFAAGTAESLAQLVLSLVDEVGPDGSRLKGMANGLFTGLMRALVWLRDNDGLDLDIEAVRRHISLKAVVGLATGASAPGLPEGVRAPLSAYLATLPGYNPERGERQAQTTLDQHGGLEMQFTKILWSLADVYGHVFRTRLSDIDMRDVVLNRRILVVMLPALEKSGDELATLGQIVVATLKATMLSALSNRITGNLDEIVDNRATNPESPFMCVLDDVGYYAVTGLALVAAQARSLGFSMIYASQDIPAMKRLNEKEAASIIANTNTKIFVRTEETGLIADLAGKSCGGGYDPFMSVGRVWAGRLEWIPSAPDTRELRSLGAGDGIVLFKGETIRIRVVHAGIDRMSPIEANPRDRTSLRANHLIALADIRAHEGAAA